MTPLTDHDAEHLGLLVVFHYVVGAIGVVTSLPAVAFLVLGGMTVTGRKGFTDPSGAPAPTAEMWPAMVVATLWLVIGLTLSTCVFLAARYLRRCERHRFCVVVAAAACVLFPAGTVLGVLTLLVLERPTVKATFVDQPVEQKA